MPRRASWARTGFLLLALLASPARAVPAPDVEFTGDPVFTAAASGAAAAPQATFATWTGGRALTLDFGAVASALAAKSSITATQDFTVGAAGGRLDVRHAFQSRLGAADVAVTVSAKLLRKASGKVARSKKSLTLRSFKAKSRSAAAALTVAEDRAIAALLAPGTWRLTVKVTYRKGRRDGLWSNAGWPAAPHVVTLGTLPGATTYVRADAASGGDGTPAHPFATIEEALAAAPDGGTVTLGPGTYGGGGDIDLLRPVTVLGAGAGSTKVQGQFMVKALAGGAPVVIDGLACDDVTWYGAALTDYAPIVVRHCDLKRVTVRNGAHDRHSYTIEDSRIAGDVQFGHGAVGVAASSSVLRCDVGGRVEFNHGAGNTTNVVRDCRVAGTVALKSGAGVTYAVTGNTVDGTYDIDDPFGILDASGACRALIAGNTVRHGISDKSGGRGLDPLPDPPDWPESWPRDWPVEDEVIERNRILDGSIASSGRSVTIRDNSIARSTRGIAIDVRSGDPTYVVGNRISVPLAAAADDPGDFGAEGFPAISSNSGWGQIRDNVVRGGSIGFYDNSRAELVAGNDFSGAFVGIWSRGAARYSGNTVRGCLGDGMRLWARGPVDGNVVTGNGRAGIRLLAPIDLGGGADGGLGGNVLRGNRGFDLVIEVPVADAATIFARNNVWDHATEAQIGELDLLDGRDDAGKAVVDFLPVRGR